MQAQLETLATEIAELKAIKERFTLAVEATRLAVWDWDVPTGKLQFHPEISSVLGYPEGAKPNYQQGRDLTHPDDLAAFDIAFEAHARGETPRYVVEYRIRTGDGDWRWIKCRGEIVARTKNGAPLRVVGTFADISKWKAETADREFLSDLTHQLMQISKPDAITSIAMKLLAQYLMADRVGISELRRDRTGFLTRAVWSHKALPPPPREHRHTYSPEVIEEVCNKGPFVVEDVQTDPRCKDSQMASLFAKMDVHGLLNIPMPSAGKSPIFLYVHSRKPRKWSVREVLLCQQVAERLWNSINRANAEAGQESAEEMLNMAMSLTKLGAIDRDYKSGAVRLSEGLLNLIGHPEMASAPLIGHLGIEYLGIIHPDDQERFAKKVAVGIARGENYELDDEHRIITAANEIRHIAYKSRLHFETDKDGIKRLSRSTAVIQDITEKVQQSEGAKLAQDRLNKMSRLTAMGTMASTLAHELNQPLTAAANYLNVLRTLDQKGEPIDGINHTDVLDLATRSVLDAGKIIKRIRNFTNGGGLQRASVPLITLANGAIRQFTDQVGQRHPEIIVNIPKRLNINVDAMQIEQVISNLLRNAAEAMLQKKGATITLSGHDQNGFVDLHVIDNGPGIPDDFAAELFNPFQSSKQEGMGLGLSLCRTMVEAHGGHLTLEKHDSTGCNFLIRLPKMARRGKLG
jgi:PAS domain S-box-containing protein